MCKKSEWLGACLASCGAGILLSLLFSSQVAQGVVGLLTMLGGLWLARKP